MSSFEQFSNTADIGAVFIILGLCLAFSEWKNEYSRHTEELDQFIEICPTKGFWCNI